MKDWSTIPFGELYAEPSRNGLMRPQRVRGSGFKMVNMGEIFAYDRINDPPMELVPMNHRELETYTLQAGDLLFARQSIVESGAGKCVIVLEVPEFTTFESHLIRVRLDTEKCLPNFYYYYFQSPVGRGKIESIITGAAQKGIRGSDLQRVAVDIPDPRIQERIAEILSAYDDLIDNNNRRIALLEEAIHRLYREWFVHLRFPGHEHTPVVDGVPEGWEIKTIAETTESIRYGYTASANQEKVGPKFLRITDIVPETIDWTTVPYCEILEDQKEKHLLREGDVVVARTGATTGYAKRIGKRFPESVFASYLVRIRFSDELDNLIAGVFLESDHYKQFIRSQIGGAAQPNANARILTSAKLLVPASPVQWQFRTLVEPMFDQKELLQVQNEKLREARDALLPRLMNGSLLV